MVCAARRSLKQAKEEENLVGNGQGEEVSERNGEHGNVKEVTDLGRQRQTTK